MSGTTQQRSRPQLTAIPDSWLEAATLFVDLPEGLPLDDDEWSVIVAWLRDTKFDDRRVLAGEVAAGLIRDHAPMRVKDQYLADDPTDERQAWFQRAIVSHFRPMARVDAAAATNDKWSITFVEMPHSLFQ